MTAILKREWKAFFYNPLGYIFIAVYFLFTGFFFFNYNLHGNTNDMRAMFDSLFTITLFLVPILTMRLFSEEQKMRTDTLLLMSPVTSIGIVTGKFIAAVAVYTMGISSTLVAAIVLQFLSPPEWAVVMGHFTGLLLLGIALIAIGIFISSLTENQIIASIGGFAVGFFMMLLDSIAAMVPSDKVATVLKILSFHSRYRPFTLGIFGLDNLVFFLSISTLFVLLTANFFERRRWR